MDRPVARATVLGEEPRAARVPYPERGAPASGDGPRQRTVDQAGLADRSADASIGAPLPRGPRRTITRTVSLVRT
jgi:hypothetical protein